MQKFRIALHNVFMLSSLANQKRDIFFEYITNAVITIITEI